MKQLKNILYSLLFVPVSLLAQINPLASSIAQFSTDSTGQCTNRWYIFSNDTDLSQNISNNCSSESSVYWELSGIQGVDWILDPSSELGSFSTSGTDVISVKYLNSDIYSVEMILSSCPNETFEKQICVKTNLNSVEEFITIDDTTCIGSPDFIHSISDNQACGMEFLWSVVPNDISCIENQSSNFNISSDLSPLPDITFFNPGIYQVSCIISDFCNDTLVISKTVNVLKSPELSSFEASYVCDSNHVSINLTIDSCVASIYNPVWETDDNDEVMFKNDTLIEIIFSDFENNEVQYTVSNQCFTFDTVYVHNFVSIDNSYGPNIDLCFQSDYKLELDNDSLNGSWLLNNSPLPIDSLGIYFFTPDHIGTFTLFYIYTDYNGCEISKFLNINVQESPQFEVVVSNQECAFDEVPFNISLSGSSSELLPGTNFFWTNSDSETTIIPSPDENPTTGLISANAGEYKSYFYFQSSLNESCYTYDSMTFVANGADFSIEADSILCDGDTTSLSLNITSVSPNGPFTVSWNESSQTFQPLEVYPDSTTTYVAYITDANNCISTDTLVLDVLCTNENLVDFEPFIVDNETVALFPNITSYENVLYEGCTNSKISFFKPDCIDISQEINIQYKVKINGINQSINSVNNNSRFFLPSVDNVFNIVIPSDSSSVTLDIFTTNNYTSDTPDTILFAINPITYSDCLSSDTSVVNVEFIIFDQPDFNLEITDSFTIYCPGDDAVIEAFPIGGVGGEMIAQGSNSDISPYIFEWNHVGSSPIQTMNPYESTTYFVTVTDACGYIQEESVEVFVTEYDPLIAIADRTYVCEDTLAKICVTVQGGEGNYTYLWSNEATTECIEVFHQPYSYPVTVTDGCYNQVVTNGFVDNGIPEIPYFEYLQVPNIDFGIEFYNYTPSLSDHRYLWIFGDSSGSNNYHPIHTYPDEGSYNVTLVVSDSIYQDCKKQFSSFVNVESYFKLWVPNSFTPNNDGVNDFFKPILTGVDYYEMIITDRWGSVVFSSSDLNESWDGYLDGKIIPSGIYKCEIIYSKFNDIMKLSHYNNINLIR